MEKKEMEELAKLVAGAVVNGLVQHEKTKEEQSKDSKILEAISNLREDLNKTRNEIFSTVNKQIEETKKEVFGKVKQIEEELIIKPREEAKKKEIEELKRSKEEAEKKLSDLENKLKTDHEWVYKEILKACPECNEPAARNIARDIAKERPDILATCAVDSEQCRLKIIELLKAKGYEVKEKKEGNGDGEKGQTKEKGFSIF